ncbi:MAG: DUF5071 domain-containing protein [Candidatus Sericytochromatia bacterium]
MSDLLPKEKGDFDSLAALEQLSDTKLLELADPLLTWLQDVNWPIMPEVAELLKRLDQKLIPHLRKVFLFQDEVWTLNCLRYIVEDMDLDFIHALKPEISRIAFAPTRSERADEVDLLAQEILQRLADDKHNAPQNDRIENI